MQRSSVVWAAPTVSLFLLAGGCSLLINPDQYVEKSNQNDGGLEDGGSQSCTSSSECTSSEPNCDSSGTCTVQTCSGNGDCVSDETCDVDSGQCVGSCTTASDCGSQESWACDSDGMCVPCDNDNDGHRWDRTECGGDDCDDFDASSYPGAPPVCDDGKIQDCNGNNQPIDDLFLGDENGLLPLVRLNTGLPQGQADSLTLAFADTDDLNGRFGYATLRVGGIGYLVGFNAPESGASQTDASFVSVPNYDSGAAVSLPNKETHALGVHRFSDDVVFGATGIIDPPSGQADQRMVLYEADTQVRLAFSDMVSQNNPLPLTAFLSHAEFVGLGQMNNAMAWVQNAGTANLRLWVVTEGQRFRFINQIAEPPTWLAGAGSVVIYDIRQAGRATGVAFWETSGNAVDQQAVPVLNQTQNLLTGRATLSNTNTASQTQDTRLFAPTQEGVWMEEYQCKFQDTCQSIDGPYIETSIHGETLFDSVQMVDSTAIVSTFDAGSGDYVVVARFVEQASFDYVRAGGSGSGGNPIALELASLSKQGITTAPTDLAASIRSTDDQVDVGVLLQIPNGASTDLWLTGYRICADE